MMYHQFYLDNLDPTEYNEFLFWSGQIPNNPNNPLDPDPQTEYNTPMENEKFNDNLEIGGDLHDEYEAIQEAEAGIEPELASDEEIKSLLTEMWDEMIPEDKADEYTEEDVYREFYADQYEDFN